MPDRLSSQPASTQVRAISGPDEKQWKITVVGRALGAQHVEDLGVGVAVVDHQRLAGALGQVDVPRERLALLGRSAQPSSLPGQYMVHPGLPDRDHSRMGGEPLDLGLGLLGERIGARRVQRHRGVHPGIPVGRLVTHRAEARSSAMVTTACDPHRLCAVQDRANVVGVDGTAGVEVGVRVDQRRQRLRGRWRLARTLELTPHNKVRTK